MLKLFETGKSHMAVLTRAPGAAEDGAATANGPAPPPGGAGKKPGGESVAGRRRVLLLPRVGPGFAVWVLKGP